MQLEFKKVKVNDLQTGMQVRKYGLVYELISVDRNVGSDRKMGAGVCWFCKRVFELVLDEWATLSGMTNDYITLFEKESLEIVAGPVRAQGQLPL